MKIKKVYLGRKQIYPDWWNPWENTLWYYTFNNTWEDTTGDNADASNISSNTFVEAYSWSSKKVLNKVSGSYVTLPATVMSTTPSRWTMLFRFKTSNTSNVRWAEAQTSEYRWTIWLWIDGYWLSMQHWGSYGNRRMAYNTAKNFRDWVWHLITFSSDNSDVIVWIDTNFSTQYRLNTTSDYSIGAWVYNIGSRASWASNTSTFQMWDFILENRSRTEQEKINYYNQTKWNYWL